MSSRIGNQTRKASQTAQRPGEGTVSTTAVDATKDYWLHN